LQLVRGFAPANPKELELDAMRSWWRKVRIANIDKDLRDKIELLILVILVLRLITLFFQSFGKS
jgi:hypothetical protein